MSHSYNRSLPKLYRPVKIKFWSLRNGVGASLGVIFDIDTKVERIARRVLCNKSPLGWKWQIISKKYDYMWDGSLDTDKESLSEAAYWNNMGDIEIDYTNLKIEWN